MEEKPSRMPSPNIVIRTADISLSEETSGIVQQESYPVIPKNNSKSEFLRPVKMSDLARIKNEAISIKGQGIKWDEVALAFSTLGFGSTFSALLSNVVLTTQNGILFFIISPVFSFSLLVFVIMYKYLKAKIDSNSVNIILNIIEPYEEIEKEVTDELK